VLLSINSSYLSFRQAFIAPIFGFCNHHLDTTTRRLGD
ncbi:LOW QUALITY PROTEIN: hypothetical protein TorRG33x02_129600, partial [Trema orientale]